MKPTSYLAIAERLREFGDDINRKHKRKDHTIFHRGASAIEHLLACHKSKDRMTDYLMMKPWKSATIAWTLLSLETMLLVCIIVAVFGDL